MIAPIPFFLNFFLITYGFFQSLFAFAQTYPPQNLGWVGIGMFLFFCMCLVDEQLKQHVGCGVEAKGNISASLRRRQRISLNMLRKLKTDHNASRQSVGETSSSGSALFMNKLCNPFSPSLKCCLLLIGTVTHMSMLGCYQPGRFDFKPLRLGGTVPKSFSCAIHLIFMPQSP